MINRNQADFDSGQTRFLLDTAAAVEAFDGERSALTAHTLRRLARETNAPLETRETARTFFLGLAEADIERTAQGFPSRKDIEQINEVLAVLERSIGAPTKKLEAKEAVRLVL